MIFNRSTPFRPRASNLRIVRNEATPSEAEILLYDEIAFYAINAQDFVRDIKDLNVDTIHLRVNSPGGGVFDGLAIANALREHPANVITHIDGLAASIASVVALAGDEVRIAKSAFLMIHDPWTIMAGNARDLRKAADTLDKIGQSIVDEYVARSGADETQVLDWMKEETWFNANEAKDAGFVDAIEGTDKEVKNSYDLSIFANVPDALRERPSAAGNPRDLERALRDAGYSRSEAQRLVAAVKQCSANNQRDAGREADDILAAGQDLLATLHSLTR